MRVQVHEKILQCNIKCACVYVCVSVSVRVQVPEKIGYYYSLASYVCACASAREDPTA